MPHLFSPAGFLDDAWWHRTYWLVATAMGTYYGGWPTVGSRVPAGRLLVLDGPVVCGFGRNQSSHTGSHIGIDSETIFHYSLNRYNPRRTHYRAFAIDRDAAPAEGEAKSGAKRGGAGPPPKNCRWTQQMPVLARAMVLAAGGGRLYLATKAGEVSCFGVGD